MFTRTLFAVLCLGWFVVPGRADEAPKHKPIDEDTIAAYKKLGAKYGGLSIDLKGNSWVKFTEGKEAAVKQAPGFWIHVNGDEKLPKLPVVKVPFGLELSGPGIRDASLKELKEQTNLTVLRIWVADVTNEGLKELKQFENLTTLRIDTTKLVTYAGVKEFKGLTTLSLDFTDVTDAGLKELKEVKNLTSLNLAYTKVTIASLNELKKLKKLTTLNIDGNDITEANLKKLKQALPKCAISP